VRAIDELRLSQDIGWRQESKAVPDAIGSSGITILSHHNLIFRYFHLGKVAIECMEKITA
jgi:hypothetical protein